MAGATVTAQHNFILLRSQLRSNDCAHKLRDGSCRPTLNSLILFFWISRSVCVSKAIDKRAHT